MLTPYTERTAMALMVEGPNIGFRGLFEQREGATN